MAGLVPFNRGPRGLRKNGYGDLFNVLDDFFNDAWTPGRSLTNDTFKMDLQETENEYLVEAELPGVRKEDINLNLNDGRLSISVNREENMEEQDNNKNYIHRERRYSSMERSIHLADTQPDGVRAKLEDGVLKVIVAKEEKANNQHRIEIE